MKINSCGQNVVVYVSLFCLILRMKLNGYCYNYYNLILLKYFDMIENFKISEKKFESIKWNKFCVYQMKKQNFGSIKWKIKILCPLDENKC